MKETSPFFAPALFALLMTLAGVSTAKSAKKPPNEAAQQARLFQKKLNKEDQVLHALDRLTFGPRPGDVRLVTKMGVKRWIDLQLHPERIRENPDLEAKLQPLESLRMTSMEVVRHYPSRQMILAIAQGRQPMPDDPLLRATVERIIARYQIRKGEEGNGKPAPDPETDMQPVRTLADILEPLELQALRSGSPDRKRALLESMPPDKLEDMLIAMPRPQRQQLFGLAPIPVQRLILLMNAPQQVVAYDLLDSKLLRAVESNRQLAEELDDFWFNHFNVYYDKGADRFLIPDYERDAIRPYVLGKFRDLARSHGEEPGHALLPGQFPVGASGSRRQQHEAKSKARLE